MQINRHSAILIFSTIVCSWLLMQAAHELGHVTAARLTGGRVAHVALHPLTISRTDLATNPHPLIVVWAGPLVGVLLPLALWLVAAKMHLQLTSILRFFAGFCLIANGAYIGLGSFARIGDCGEMLRHGSSAWQLWIFGAITMPTGLWLWNGLGARFGIGPNASKPSSRLAYSMLILATILITAGLLFGHR